MCRRLRNTKRGIFSFPIKSIVLQADTVHIQNQESYRSYLYPSILLGGIYRGILLKGISNQCFLSQQKKSIYSNNSTYLPKISNNYFSARSWNITMNGNIMMIITFYCNFPSQLTERASSPIISSKFRLPIYIPLHKRLLLQPRSLDLTLTTQPFHSIPVLLAIKHVIAGTAIRPHTLVNLLESCSRWRPLLYFHRRYINSQTNIIGPHTMSFFV